MMMLIELAGGLFGTVFGFMKARPIAALVIVAWGVQAAFGWYSAWTTSSELEQAQAEKLEYANLWIDTMQRVAITDSVVLERTITGKNKNAEAVIKKAESEAGCDSWVAGAAPDDCASRMQSFFTAHTIGGPRPNGTPLNPADGL